jgi:prolyl oligopeptidase
VCCTEHRRSAIPERSFFDPNKLTADGTAALSGSSFTDDGKLWAYGIAKSGSDRTEWKVMNTETGDYLSDTLRPNRQGGVSWLNDNSGFFYSRFPDAEQGVELKGANKFQRLYFHKLGTPQSEDYVVYERPDDGELFVGGNVTEDGNWLIISVAKGTERMNMVYFKNLTMEKAPILPLVTDRKNSYSFVGNDGSTFYFRTDNEAERGRLVSIDVSAKDRTWKEIVPQAEEL